MNKQRLLLLADFLDSPAVDKKRFVMDYWREGDSLEECGFSGCAMGWAQFIPEFQALGYGFASAPNYYSHEPRFWDENDDPVFGLTAVVHLFELEPGFYYDTLAGPRTGFDLASHLFGGNEQGYSTPKQVAKRIRQIVRLN